MRLALELFNTCLALYGDPRRALAAWDDEVSHNRGLYSDVHEHLGQYRDVLVRLVVAAEHYRMVGSVA